MPKVASIVSSTLLKLEPLARKGLLLGYTAPEDELVRATAQLCEVIARELS